jgi:hypothetical protein
MLRISARFVFVIMLVTVAGSLGCGGATPEAAIEKAAAVEVTFYYLPG